MKKIFALLASLLMISSCAVMSASAYDVVIAVNEADSSKWVTRESVASSANPYDPMHVRSVGCKYVNSKKIADFNPAQETFEFGDIVTYENALCSQYDWEGTLDTDMYSFEVYDKDKPYGVYKVGSIFDNPETEQFTVIPGWRDDILLLKNDEEEAFTYNFDWFTHYYQPDCVDLTTLHSGDVVSCIIYNDVPMLVTETVYSAPPSGDADGNGKLDILDVITVNRAVLGKESLSADRAYHADLNQSGAPDPLDSMLMMRKIVGID